MIHRVGPVRPNLHFENRVHALARNALNRNSNRSQFFSEQARVLDLMTDTLWENWQRTRQEIDSLLEQADTGRHELTNLEIERLYLTGAGLGSFGLGVATAVKDGAKIEVLFENGPKLLVHGR